MTNPRKPASICAPIAYHDYAMLMMSVDAEWSRRRLRPSQVGNAASHLRDLRSLVEYCYEFAGRVNANHRAFRKANRGFPKRSNGDSEAELNNHLFNPMLWVPFGHADETANS
jgi:hypothetical protein